MKTADNTNLSSAGPIQLTAEDLAHAARLNLRQAFFSLKFLFKFVTVIVIASLVICTFYYHVIDQTPSPGVVLMIGALWIATAILTLYGLAYVGAPRQMRKIFKQQKNLHKPYTLTWDGDRLESTSEAGNARLAWDELLKMCEDSKIMLFYESEQLYRLIPKRYLTQDQIASLRQSWLDGHG